MRILAAAAALLLASCYDPAGECAKDGDCLAGQVCGADGLCVAGTPPPPGEPPVAAADAYTFAGSGPFDVAAPGVLANDTAPGGGALAAQVEPAGTMRTTAGGTIFLAPDGGFTYAPPAQGWTGSDGFAYRATSGVTSSGSTQVSLTVTP